jgi:hypothetical protein
MDSSAWPAVGAWVIPGIFCSACAVSVSVVTGIRQGIATARRVSGDRQDYRRAGFRLAGRPAFCSRVVMYGGRRLSVTSLEEVQERLAPSRSAGVRWFVGR